MPYAEKDKKELDSLSSAIYRAKKIGDQAEVDRLYAQRVNRTMELEVHIHTPIPLAFMFPYSWCTCVCVCVRVYVCVLSM